MISKFEIPRCERIDSPTGRLYKTPSGNLYPSVSTIIGATSDSSYLDKWREAVGEETANKISKKATDRGSLIHENVERWFDGRPKTFNMFQGEERQMFENLVPVLEQCSEVYAIETPMWSDLMRAAGTPDFVGAYMNVPTVVDWKTSGRYKRKEEVPHYFIQAAAYAQMFYERTGVAVPNILIAITTQDDGVLLYRDKVKHWFPVWKETRAKFDSL